MLLYKSKEIKDFLRHIHLIDNLTTELEMEKGSFVDELKKTVDAGKIGGILSYSFDVFSPGNNEYKGKVDYDGFKIKKKRKPFSMFPSMAVANGLYQQKGKFLRIETEINSFIPVMVPFYIFCVSLYFIFIVVFLTADEIGGDMPRFIAIPFIFFHAAFMMGIPYFMMRKSTQTLKHELEREFKYLTKK